MSRLVRGEARQSPEGRGAGAVAVRLRRVRRPVCRGARRSPVPATVVSSPSSAAASDPPLDPQAATPTRRKAPTAAVASRRRVRFTKDAPKGRRGDDT